MPKQVKPISARFIGDLARLLEQRGIGQDILETRCRDNINDFVRWLTASPKSNTKRRANNVHDIPLATKSAKRELRRKYREDLQDEL